jgi:hypothetical protein
MKTPSLFLTLLAVLATVYIQADTLELKNGKTLNGKYVGGTAGTIRFETPEGVQVIETGQALALTFTGGGAASAPAAAAAAPAPAASAVTVPAGTRCSCAWWIRCPRRTRKASASPPHLKLTWR